MTNPFHIFPGIGYKNSQFQVVSTVDDLRVDFMQGDKLLRSELVNSDYPIIITSLNAVGKVIAKCTIKNREYTQEIEIRDALRLGSSVFKRAFLFDDTDFSFFLMKDRLLLYDEKKQILLTENHYSPTEIHQLNKSEYLFTTQIGSKEEGIMNLGVYTTDKFSLVSELLNDYREIKRIPESNAVWLYNIKENAIQYFQVTDGAGTYFKQLKIIDDGFESYHLSEDESLLIIQYPDKLLFLDIHNLQRQISITFQSNNAIDVYGNVYTSKEDQLTCINSLREYAQEIKLPFKINLVSDHFLHIGDEFTIEHQKIDFQQQVDQQYDHLISAIPANYNQYTHTFKTEDITNDVHIQHNLYCTTKGIFVIEKNTIRSLSKIRFESKHGEWHKKPTVTTNIEYSVMYLNHEVDVVLTQKDSSLVVVAYLFPILQVRTGEKKVLFSGCRLISMPYENEVKLFRIEDITYFTLETREQFSLYKSSDFQHALLNKVRILNSRFFREHKIIWYSGNERINSQSNHLNAFDLSKCSRISIDQHKLEANSFTHLNNCKFEKRHAFSHDQLIFNPKTLEVKSAIIGKIESLSSNLNKVLSSRENTLILSRYNDKTSRYDLTEIPLQTEKFKESYLSPDGRFLVLQEMNNSYCYYDVEKNERINFISGNFLSFRKDGSLIVEKEQRSIRIIDPVTFLEVTSPNYHHYRFQSPDGKLYAQLSTKTRYTHRLYESEIQENVLYAFKIFIDMPKNVFNKDEFDKAKTRVERNRKELFEKYRTKCLALNISSPEQINSEKLIQVDRFIEIGITGTDVVAEVPVPSDMEFYNHAAFSYDNKYFGYVGKPTFNGLIHLYQLDVDVSKLLLKIKNSYLTRLPKRASWVCGFSKTGYFATYDSIPDTYIIFVDDSLFESRLYEFDLRYKMKQNKSNIYHTYKNWNIIEKKNFLTFSSSGKYLALSEQGYDPLTLCGHGHQESNVVHIAKTDNGEVLNSFTGHGDRISYNRGKNVVFVSFSEDEKKIMTLSADGVVFIRDINLADT